MNERASRWMLLAMLAFGTLALSACGRGEPPPARVPGAEAETEKIPTQPKDVKRDQGPSSSGGPSTSGPPDPS